MLIMQKIQSESESVTELSIDAAVLSDDAELFVVLLRPATFF